MWRKNSDVETFCAMKLCIDSWRWAGVPWYLRSGKYMPETACEVLVELKAPPQRLFADSAPANGRATICAFALTQLHDRFGCSSEASGKGVRWRSSASSI